MVQNIYIRKAAYFRYSKNTQKKNCKMDERIDVDAPLWDQTTFYGKFVYPRPWHKTIAYLLGVGKMMGSMLGPKLHHS